MDREDPYRRTHRTAHESGQGARGRNHRDPEFPLSVYGQGQRVLEKIVHSQFRQMVMPAVLGLRTIDDEEQIGTIEDAAAILTACAREKSE